MRRVRYSAQSQRDIDGIVDHIAGDNVAAADRWFDQIQHVLTLLAAHPESSEQIETRRYGVIRRHTHGNYVIYYRPRSCDVFVLRVLHGARDQARDL